MSRRSHSLLALLLALAAPACAARGPSLDQLPSQELAGHYTGGPDASWFRPCGAAAGTGEWWVTFTDRAVTQRDSLRRRGVLAEGTTHFVRWRAAVTEGGEIGPRGPGVPALLVRDILVARPAAAGDCPR